MNTQLFSLKNFALLFLLGFMIVLSSCQEEPDLIGMSLQSQNERFGVLFSDTSSIIAYSVFDDSLRTDNYSASLLGTFNDPVFGTTTANIFTQVRLSTLNPSFTSASFDSLVLYLPYSGSYQIDPATMGDLQLKVYEVTDKMYIDSVYYSDRKLNDNGLELANKTFTPKPTDSVTINGVKYPAILQIKLNTTAANDLANKLLTAGTSLANNDVFTAMFKGITIKSIPLTSQENKGSVLYFNLLSTLAKMTLYYKKAATDTVSTQYDFVFNDKAPKYTQFVHYDYKGLNATLAAEDSLKKQLGVTGYIKDISLGQQKLYLQSMGGVKVNFKFPYLRNWTKGQKIVINEATLVIKNIDPNEKAVPPSMLTILNRTGDGKTAFLPDIFEGSSFFGGTYSNGEYRMRITRYFQNMLNYTDADFVDYGLVMLIDSRRTTANRFVFAGTDKNLSKRMKLELKYTVIK
ncbi:MAG: DUF4270 family protein [Bacteroidales bacterium]